MTYPRTQAMEASFDTCMDPRVTRVDFKALRRLGALEKDMAYYYDGDDWQNKAQPSPATRAYTDHIKRVAVSAAHECAFVV